MVDVADARVLAVLTRAPSSGGKSRLFAELGRPPDRRLLEAMLVDTVDGASPRGVRRAIAVTPGSACDEMRQLVQDAVVFPQEEGDLGQRMRAAMAHLFALGARAVVLIGSDLPHITTAPVATAFAALDDDAEAIVLGPSTDGGYYLVGATRVPDIFTEIEWGSARALEQTLDAAAARGLRVRLLAQMTDVDTVDDLRRVAASPTPPSRTAAWLADSGID